MFKYINDVSELIHKIVKNNCVDFKLAVDCTLGNGYDTKFLSDNFEKVYAFDIQESATATYKKLGRTNVEVINDCHSKLVDYIKCDENDGASFKSVSSVDCFIYNLGFLPGGDKNITTNVNTTLESIEVALDLLKTNGLLLVAGYRGHAQGKLEEEAILDFCEKLPKERFAVMYHSFLNRSKNAPILLVIEKNESL